MCDHVQANSSGVDPWLILFFLKLCAPIIAEQVAHLFNLSVATGVFPQVWKTAHVLPLHKGGDKTDLTNYWPIYKLSCLAKILESLVNNQIKSFLSCNHVLNPHQSGLEQITVHHCSHICHKWYHFSVRPEEILCCFICRLNKSFRYCWPLPASWKVLTLYSVNVSRTTFHREINVLLLIIVVLCVCLYQKVYHKGQYWVLLYLQYISTISHPL